MATKSKKDAAPKKVTAKKPVTTKKAVAKEKPEVEVVEEVDGPVYMGRGYAVKIIALGWKTSFRNNLIDVKKKDVYFTRDGITEKCDISRRNVFATPRKALLAFNQFLLRHDEFDYVDIIMSEHNEYIV